MRTLVKSMAAVLLLGVAAERICAQYPLGFYSSGFAVNPYVMPPAFSTFSGYASPYGYRSYFNASAYPGPWGYNTYYNYGTFARPFVSGPFHSVVYNPFTLGYRYMPGYLNAPVFFYGYAGW
ncbi:MAG: hypothetical protein FJ271_02245 [Planctomycetes bacterium]|nr:hypothetical protein [Planctomycetota bacterium]